MKAFTLVETLVAISIIMIAVVGPFEVIEHALAAAQISRDELIGNSLAQEGVEYVIGLRAGNYLYNRANPSATPQCWFMDGLDGTNSPICTNTGPNCITNVCSIDPLASTPVRAYSSVSLVPALYVGASSSGYLYNQQSSGTQSKFTRSMQFCYMNGSTCNSTLSNEVRLTMTVTWNSENHPFTTTITEYLQNWL